MFLLALNAVQLAVIVTILTMWYHSNLYSHCPIADSTRSSVAAPNSSIIKNGSPSLLPPAATTVSQRPLSRPPAAKIASPPPPIAPDCSAGVAITFMLHSPKWFQRRYTVMVQNILANLPSRWCVQIFHTGKGQSKNGVDINRGLQRAISRNEVTMTLIPEDIFDKKRKKKELITDRWVWENVLSDRVLVFGGNQVMCGNSALELESDFGNFDYIGTPWGDRRGAGGDGGISLRSRSAMLEAIKYREATNTPYNGNEREDVFFVRTLQDMIKANKQVTSPGTTDPRPIRLADMTDTEKFGGIKNFTEKFQTTVKDRNTETIGPALVASGTLPSMPYDMRDAFLTVCPELKMIFPSLHEPSCFGAHPDAEGCKKSICALRDPPRKGGC